MSAVERLSYADSESLVLIVRDFMVQRGYSPHVLPQVAALFLLLYARSLLEVNPQLRVATVAQSLRGITEDIIKKLDKPPVRESAT